MGNATGRNRSAGTPEQPSLRRKASVPLALALAVLLGWGIAQLEALYGAEARPAVVGRAVSGAEEDRSLALEIADLRAEVRRLGAHRSEVSLSRDAGSRGVEPTAESEPLPADSIGIMNLLDAEMASDGEDRAHANEVLVASSDAIREAGLEGTAEVASVSCGSRACRIMLRHPSAVSAEMMGRLNTHGPFRGEMFVNEEQLPDGSSGTIAYLAREGRSLLRD